MSRRLLALVLTTSVLGALWVPAVASEEDLSRCGAIRLEDRPPLGGGGFETARYQRRHNEFLKRHPDVFASGYLSGKRFYVGFTHDVCHYLRLFRKGLKNPWRVEAFHADWTYRQLRRTQRCVVDMFEKRWLKISGVGSDVWRNKTEVMLEENTERRRNYIRDRCGPATLRFVEGTVSPA